jgi:2-keto-4-pentenoate hydratase/2-oxohepta-3-ene-1,7-dioic acid hydratase in catechol pathway
VGLNFRSHVEQNAIALGQPIEIPDIPLFFSKPVTAVTGPDTPIKLDERLTSKLDWEVELTMVIGTGGTWIGEDEAKRHIFGYTIANDVSARDLQWRTSQFLYGKGQDTYCPLGPVIVTADEVPDLDDIEVELLVNGEVMQRESAGHMLFRPERVIAELSKGITLEPGDVITLGTPDGCGYQMVPPRFLKAGTSLSAAPPASAAHPPLPAGRGRPHPRGHRGGRRRHPGAR